MEAINNHPPTINMRTKINKLRMAEEIKDRLGEAIEQVKLWSARLTENYNPQTEQAESACVWAEQGRKNALNVLRLYYSAGAAVVCGDMPRYARLQKVLAELHVRAERISKHFELAAMQKGDGA